MVIPVKKIQLNLSDLMDSDIFALLGVSEIFDYVDGKRTDTISGIRYSVANPNTFENFEVKVAGTKPLVTQERIDRADERLWVSFSFVKF